MAKVYFTWDDGCTTDLKLFELHKKYKKGLICLE